jgi:hypothetical protein
MVCFFVFRFLGKGYLNQNLPTFLDALKQSNETSELQQNKEKIEQNVSSEKPPLSPKMPSRKVERVPSNEDSSGRSKSPPNSNNTDIRKRVLRKSKNQKK